MAERLYLVAEERITDYDGDLEDYARWLTERRRAPGQCAPGRRPRTGEGGRARRQASAQHRQRLKPLRQELARLEAELARLGGQQAALEEALADAAVYQDDARDRLKSLLVDRGRVERALGGRVGGRVGWAAGERLERIQADNGEE